MKPLKQQPFLTLSLGVSAVVLMYALIARHPSLFAVGYFACVGCLVRFARKSANRRERSVILDTPEMGALISDVRERDRAFRDGMWVMEYVMNDAGPRALLGLVVFSLLAVVMVSPLYLILANFAGAAPVPTSVVIATGLFATAWLLS